MAAKKTARASAAKASGGAKQRSYEANDPAGADGGQGAVQRAIAAMPEADRVLAERVHAIVSAVAPTLSPRTWYGMPAYARQGKVVCFFQSASKFGTRYATLGFTDAARLDEGAMWPTAFAIAELTPDVEERIAALLGRAIG